MKSKIHEYQNSFFTMSKTKIKILVMTVALTLFMSGNATAQGMPTYDNTNFISLVKQLIESGKQTANIIKTVQFLKTQKENIEKVNNVVRQLKAVREIDATINALSK